MRLGKEYEEFVYTKFKDFYKDFNVTLNDKIVGKQSYIKREIDVSIKGKIKNIELLYLVQCKDHSKPADVTIIGEFSSVIKDVGASKGFLICTSGFAKTIHHYARTLGIELITVEDINSTKWKAEIEIPIVYIKKKVQVLLSSKIKANQELVEKNKTELQISQQDFEEVSLDYGRTTIKLLDFINQKIVSDKIDLSVTKQLNIDDQNLLLKFQEIWIPAKFYLRFFIEKTYYLKYILPTEYSQIIDHVRKDVIPLKLSIKKFNALFDDSYVEIDKNDIPIFTKFNFEIEENSFSFKKSSLKSMNINSVTF